MTTAAIQNSGSEAPDKLQLISMLKAELLRAEYHANCGTDCSYDAGCQHDRDYERDTDYERHTDSRG